MDIQIGCRNYKHAETYTVGKLEHLVQLIDIELTNYKNYAKNYPPITYEKTAKPYIAKLESEKLKVQELLSQKV